MITLATAPSGKFEMNHQPVETGKPERSRLTDRFSLLDLPKITDGRGDLTFVEGLRHIPFEIARVYYLYNVPQSMMRAGHAHYELRQLMIAISGTFDLHLDDGFERTVVRLDRPDRGLLLGSMVWREIHAFSPGAVCVVMASLRYDEADYIRDYDSFLAAARSHP